jgi:hypothetical protein|nr:MAG TPA: endoplasmic reticulum chaperone [Caudoviricetes sp.]
MIVITNGVKSIMVTTGAYKDIFKGQGWSPVEGEIGDLSHENSQSEENPEGGEENLTEEKFDGKNDDLDEEGSDDDSEPESDDIDFNSMTIKELNTFAEEHGIDVSGVSVKADIIALILSELED